MSKQKIPINNKVTHLGITREFYNWDDVPLLISLSEACALLHLTEDTVRKLCNDGVLPSVKLNGSWRIDKEKLKKMFETKTS